MIQPTSLVKGDVIGLVATARKISREELAPAINVLEGWGFKVATGEHLFGEENQFSASDEKRLSDFQNFIDDPEVKAILCVRGGYGTVRIIDGINFLPLIENPKWIAGYSDVTVLHNKLSRLGIESLHSTMPISFATNTPQALESLQASLTGESISYNVATHPLNKEGHTQGKLVGGNLSMIYSQTGSDTSLKTAGNILFLEDLDEYLYHIDRMMYNLKRNGYFDELAGVIVGGMTDMNDNTVPFGENAEEIIHRHFSIFNYPICFGFPAGHLDDNRSLIFGRTATLEVSETETNLSFDG